MEMPPSAEVVPVVEVPPSAEIVVPASEETTSTVGVSEDYNYAALEEFISKVTKNISPPLVDKPPHRRRVDPILVDAPPLLASSEADGLMRSHRQAPPSLGRQAGKARGGAPDAPAR